MKKFILSVSIFLLPSILDAQITFQKSIGGIEYNGGRVVRPTSDGGYIVVGTTEIFALGNSDVYLLKTDVNGDTLWTKFFTGSGLDNGNYIQQTDDDGYIIAGTTESYGAGSADILLIKTDSIGNLLWEKTFGGPDAELGYAVQQTTDGGYIVAGTTFSFGAGTSDMYVIKTDSNGDTLWSKTYGGGSDNDEASSVWQTSDGGFIITGLTLNFTVGLENVLLIKTGVTGTVIWKKYIGNGGGFDWGSRVQQTTDGGYIVIGATSSAGAGGKDFLLIKTDANGDTLWIKTYGGIDDDLGGTVQQTSDGGYILFGYTSSFGAGDEDFLLIKTDSIGDTLWAKTYGDTGIDWGAFAQQTPDGGYILTGETYNWTTSDWNIYLIKTDSLGNSNCNEGNPIVQVTNPPLHIAIHPVIVTSPSTIVTTPVTPVGSGGIINTLCTSVGINELTTNNSFFIFPNPSTGNFIISFERVILKGNFEILNILGEKVLTDNISHESKREINLGNVSQGIYFVKVVDGEKSYCKKLIVEDD